MSQYIIVDTINDSRIAYTGPWVTVIGSIDFGGPLPSTNRVVQSNSNASFTYPFTGSRVILSGTTRGSNNTVAVTASWGCTVDNKPMVNASTTADLNNVLLCEFDDLSDDSHLLTWNVTVFNGGTFRLDSIEYLPTSKTDLTNTTIIVYPMDPGFKVDSGWLPHSQAGNMTSVTGSKLSYTFIGTSLFYHGFIDPFLPLDTTPNTGSYSIDGQPPVFFNVFPGISSQKANAGMQYHFQAFSTGPLSPGTHTIDIVNHGTSENTPLTFAYLGVERGTSVGGLLPTTSTSSSEIVQSVSQSTVNTATETQATPAGPTNTSHPDNKRTDLLHKGVIVGPVVGAVVLLLLAALFLRFRRQRQRAAQLAIFREFPDPFTDPEDARNGPRARARLFKGAVSAQPTLPVANQQSSSNELTPPSYTADEFVYSPGNKQVQS